MAKVQTRRAISVNRTIYEATKAYAEANKTSMSALVEDLLRDRLGIDQVPGRKLPPRTSALEELVSSPEGGETPPEDKNEIVRPPVDPKVVAAMHNIAARLSAPKKREITNPCRRERCRKMELHEDGDCR